MNKSVGLSEEQENDFKRIVDDIRVNHRAYEHAHPVAIMLKLFINAGLGIITIVYLNILGSSWLDLFTLPQSDSSYEAKMVFALKVMCGTGAFLMHLLNATQAVRINYPFVSANMERIFVNPHKHTATSAWGQFAMIFREVFLFFFNTFTRVPLILIWRICTLPFIIARCVHPSIDFLGFGKHFTWRNWVVSIVSSLDILFTMFIFVLGVTIIFASQNATDVLANLAVASIFSNMDDQAVHLFRRYERDIYDKQRDYLSDKANLALKWSRDQHYYLPEELDDPERTTCCGLLVQATSLGRSRRHMNGTRTVTTGPDPDNEEPRDWA